MPKVSTQAIQCSQRRFRKQNDSRDWEIGGNGLPNKVINEKYWQLKDISVDPRHIPSEPIDIEDKPNIEELIKEKTRAEAIKIEDMLQKPGGR